jgi:uncharacterized C2H2 Zn-finger protein
MLPERLGSALDETLRRVALENTPTDDIRLGTKRRSRAPALIARTFGKVGHRRRNLIPCPQGCGAFLRSSKLNRHLKKAHLIESNASDVTATINPVRPSSLKSERKYEVCSICKATVRVERLERHMTRAHQRRLVPAPPANNLDATPTLSPTNRPAATTQPSKAVVIGEVNRNESCPLCGASIRIGGMKRHMTKAHTSSLANPLFTEVVRQASLAHQRAHSTLPIRHDISPSPEKITRCPVCKVAIKVNRFEKHMRKVHRKRVVVRSAKNAMRQSTTLVSPRDKNLDATKLYAHPYREQGKFGSHPSHDGFDDESSPD